MLAYLIFLEGIANLILSIILIRKMGLIGVAWGTVIPDLIVTAIVVPLYTLRTLKLDVREYLVKAWVRPLIRALPAVAMGYVFSVAVKETSKGIFAAEVATLCAVFGLMSFSLCLDSEQRAMTRRKVRGLVHREPVVIHEA